MVVLSDTIPRVSARDLLITLFFLARSNGPSTLENIRLRLCMDRNVKRKGSYLWSRARDVAQELRRLNLLNVRALPRDSKTYKEFVNEPVTLTIEGQNFYGVAKENTAKAYDDLFCLLYEHHPYLRSFVGVIQKQDLNLPIFTSYKDHVGNDYRSADVLADHISRGIFDIEAVLGKIIERCHTSLIFPNIEDSLRFSLREMSEGSRQAASSEEPTEFAKKFLNQLNERIIPVLLKPLGLDFDYRTHRMLWQLGEEFQTWWDTSYHPRENGTLVFMTSKIETDRTFVKSLEFPNGMQSLSDNFLKKLFESYQIFKSLTGFTYAEAWTLRAIFCYENRCSPIVFETLMDKYYQGDSTYGVQLEIERRRPRHIRALVVGKRRIGTIAVSRKLGGN